MTVGENKIYHPIQQDWVNFLRPSRRPAERTFSSRSSLLPMAATPSTAIAPWLTARRSVATWHGEVHTINGPDQLLSQIPRPNRVDAIKVCPFPA